MASEQDQATPNSSRMGVGGPDKPLPLAEGGKGRESNFSFRIGLLGSSSEWSMSTCIKAVLIRFSEQSRRGGDGGGRGKADWEGDGLGDKLEEWKIEISKVHCTHVRNSQQIHLKLHVFLKAACETFFSQVGREERMFPGFLT